MTAGSPPPRVSVICTTRNAEQTLSETLASIRGQTLRDFEMVVVDDGSSDGTLAILREAAAADPRLRIIEAGFIGRGPALQRAIAETSAPLIANIDADDISHPSRLECLVDAAYAHRDVGLFHTRSLRFREAAEIKWPELSLSAPRVSETGVLLLVHNTIDHSSILMRRDAYSLAGGYDAARKAQIDYDLWLRFLLGGVKIAEVPLTLAAKRVHAGQSFEAGSRGYAQSSLALQRAALRRHPLGWMLWPLYGIRAIWILQPAGWRRAVKRVLAAR